MLYNSRILAFILALLLAIATTIIVYISVDVNFSILVILFITLFAVTYTITWCIIELFFFREIRKLISQIKNKDFSRLTNDNKNIHNPLNELNQEIYDYASTKQKEIEELKKMEQFRREFVANVSHELKTPIFAAQGFVHTLLDGAVLDKSVRNTFLKKAAKSLDDLNMLVQDLLVLSQIETGEIKMYFEFFDMGLLLSDIIDQFEDKAHKKKTELELRLPKGNKDLNVYGDWRRIQQVLNNLISNAINYTNEGGTVSIIVKADEKFIEITVKDTGVGIPEEDIARIFERFYRVDKSRSRSRGGTGLGLAIVKHIIEGHKTSIKVNSEPGKGSAFSFKLGNTEF